MDAYDGLKEENPNTPHCLCAWRRRRSNMTQNCHVNAVFLASEHSSSMLKSSVLFYFLIYTQQVPGSL